MPASFCSISFLAVYIHPIKQAKMGDVVEF